MEKNVKQANIVCSEKTLVVGILARDCVHGLREKMNKIEELGCMFRNYHVVIYENDSIDGTAEEVKKWGERNTHVLAISEKNPFSPMEAPLYCPYPEKGVRRIERMTRLRNRIMDEIEKHFEPDFCCFIDIDIQDFNPLEIVNAIESSPDDWGGIFGNGIVYWDRNDGKSFVSPFQYDSYAFVAKGDDYLKRGDYVAKSEFHPQVSYQMTLSLKNNEYLSCESAFNGIGIYRYEAIKCERYSVLQNDALRAINCCLCEHIGFNGKVREKGYGIYIDRNLKVVYRHEKIEDIVADIVRYYNGICVMSEDQLPFGLSEIIPGIKEVLRTWDEMKKEIETLGEKVNHQNSELNHLNDKYNSLNDKYNSLNDKYNSLNDRSVFLSNECTHLRKEKENISYELNSNRSREEAYMSYAFFKILYKLIRAYRKHIRGYEIY